MNTNCGVFVFRIVQKTVQLIFKRCLRKQIQAEKKKDEPHKKLYIHFCYFYRSKIAVYRTSKNKGMLRTILLVGSGGFIGSVMRYLVQYYMEKNLVSTFPWG